MESVPPAVAGGCRDVDDPPATAGGTDLCLSGSGLLREEGSECDVRPATPEDLDWIARLEIEAYSAEYAVARAKLDEWFCANPRGFSILRMGGREIGQMTVLPLRPALLDGFARGTIREQDIRGASLYTPAERDLVRALHVESIIIQPPEGRSNPPLKALMCLGRNFIPLFEKVCEPANLENVYALGASGRGESFMLGLGFTRVGSAAGPRALHAVSFAALRANIAALYNRRRKLSDSGGRP